MINDTHAIYDSYQVVWTVLKQLLTTFNSCQVVLTVFSMLIIIDNSNVHIYLNWVDTTKFPG